MRYPFFVNYKIAIFCRGFAAEVKIRARVLGEATMDDGVWMFGVNPGGIAASALTLDDAHDAFANRLRSVLLDIADEAADLDAFTRDVTEFVGCTNEPYQAMWVAALEAVRAGHLESPKPTLERQDGDSSAEVRIARISNPTPSMNEPQLAVARAA